MSKGIKVAVTVVVALASFALALVALPAAAQDSTSAAPGGAGNVLRIGWAQDPNTLNPFVGQDEEAYTVWALNWDLPINFSPKTLGPAPGIAESWEVSEDRKTVTLTLDPGMKWSDGKPITSRDVKWSLEQLGGHGILFAGYTSGITRIETPDPETVVIHTKRPDARIVGGLFVYVLPEHVWGKVPLSRLKGQYQPKLPLVGSGPYVVTEYERRKIITMERNPNWRGEPGPYDQVQFIRYGNQDAVERALDLGEIDLVREVESSSFARLGEQEDVSTRRSATPAYTQLAFNLCPERLCPDAEFNPAVQDRTVRQAIAYAVDREKLNEIATRGTSFVANGILPSYYKAFYETPEQTYPFDPDLANQMLDEAGWTLNDDGVREKDGETLSFDLYVRSESPSTVQMAKLIAEMTREIGVEFNVQVVSTDKLYDLTVRYQDGKPAPAFDTFIWGWGGDPYDPSFLLSILTTGEIGGSSDAFYSNAEYDRLYREQTGIFDTEERKAVIQRMVEITQRDLPYLVLTEDPQLQAYRTDEIETIEPICPEETGDLFCDQVSYDGVLALRPVAGASSETGGGNAGLAGLIGLVVGFIGGVIVTRMRSQGRDEPLELSE
ncbi:MAG: peptide ABC transporter substrate-binding protein [Acidobacteria bacterium]|nr:MAG: peptide ABC transporter substrate-binding protein [Acidobacteriota bacterium]GIK77659.1 MAG: peptide ABC transporter substrate-binding protein [Actinomycetes bacterium]